MQHLERGPINNRLNIPITGYKSIIEYSTQNRSIWNNFISKSKNALFQHKREYLEYHKDRFMDNSLLFMKSNNVQCLLPANLKDNKLFSHNGVTFGGFLIASTLKQKEILLMFDELIAYAQNKSISKIVFRPRRIYTTNIFRKKFSTHFLKTML